MPFGVRPWSVQPSYGTYKSPYGPKYNAHSIATESLLTKDQVQGQRKFPWLEFDQRLETVRRIHSPSRNISAVA